MVRASCYNCRDRKPGCHSTCGIYLQYKQRLAKIKENKEVYKLGYSLSRIRKYAVR